VIQCSDRARFALEPSAHLGIARDVGGQHLDRDRALESRITGLVDFAHPAGAKRADDLIRAEASAWS
jgi:hypothetical protein